MRLGILAVLSALIGWTANADVLDEISARGEIRFGVRMAAAPFSFIDDQGEASGLAVSLCRRVAKSLSRRLGKPQLATTFVPVDSVSRFTAIATGKVDVHCGPMTASLSRRETLDFSIPYFIDGIGIALRDGSDVDGIEDLSGQTVGALSGTTSVMLAGKIGKSVGSQVQEFPSHRAGLTALAQGEIAIYFGDQGLLLHQVATLKSENPDMQISLTSDQYSYEPYSLSMRTGERRLRLEVDRALSEVYLSQEVFDDIEAALGKFQMSELASILYVMVALPE